MSRAVRYIMDGYARLTSAVGRWTVLSAALAAVLPVLSLVNYSSAPVRREAEHVQKALLAREKILQGYVDKAFDVSPSEWVCFTDFPDDMVIYKYCADTIQSWVNRFPINNDEVDLTPLWYHLGDMESLNLFNTPLAYLSDGEQYVNLGSAWYVINVCRKGGVKIIAGILVKTEYVTQNSALKNSVNSKLLLVSRYDTVPVFIDDGDVIYGSDGSPLFSIVDKSPLSEPVTGTVMKWLSLLFLVTAAFALHAHRRDFRSLGLTVMALAFSVVASRWLTRALSVDNMLFSPTLYADSVIFDSLGEMLIWHLILFLLIAALFMCRRTLLRCRSRAGASRVRWIFPCLLMLAASVCMAYIHFSLKSVILNSSIVLELYQIDDLSVWTFLVYAAFGLLYMGLLLCLYMLLPLLGVRPRFRVLSWKGTTIYTCLVSLYTVLMVALYGFSKESRECRIWTDRLSMERDLTLEMQLRLVEEQISSDPIIRMLMHVDRGASSIVSRITDQYLWNVTQKYDIRATICGEGEMVLTENYPKPVGCRSFFQDQIINKWGVRLGSGSPFWYVNNYQNATGYIGWWTFPVKGAPVDLYIEIDSKPSPEGAIGYPALLLGSGIRTGNIIPSRYSCARYYDGKLVSSSGTYIYSVNFADEPHAPAYHHARVGGYIHFINHISPDGVVAVSRPLRGWQQYVMYLSYLILLFGAMFFCIVRTIRRRNDRAGFMPVRHSFRRRITILLTASLLFALAVMATGSLVFVIHLTENTSRNQMQEKLKTVQTALSAFFRYASDYREINNLNMFNAMDGVSATAKVDVNLYDPHGSLIRSTKPEIFSKYLASSRMDPDAFHAIKYGSRLSVIQKEKIADMPYYSLYAPVFNENGTLVTVINIPFFMDRSGFWQGSSTFIIASIIDVYLLLLFFTLLGGVTMANAVARPISQISRRMQEMNISQEPHHINYRGSDELGVLVSSYNRMVDDVKRSAIQLAQSEREQAWREMARQIAHEIKNPLTPMKLSIQHLIRMKRMNAPGWQDRVEALSASLIEQIDILSETASEFSSFARFYNEDDVDFDLVSLLREEKLLFDSSENVGLELVCGLESAPVTLKKSQITRALVNLISNAFQALDGTAGGIVRVTLSGSEAWYRIDVEDNGSGVAEENRERLFKPNFTTKSGGTGLGLAITRNIVEQSRGRIWYETSTLGGACFSMELPCGGA